MKGKTAWKRRKREAMNTIRRQKHTWFCSCRGDIPGKRLLRCQAFTSVDRLRTVWCKRYRHGEKPLSRTQGRGIQPNCEKPCSNGWLRPAAPIHRCPAERCKRRCKNSSVSVSVLGTSIVSAPNWVLGITLGARKKTANAVFSTGSPVARGCWRLAPRRRRARDRIAGNPRACIACLCIPFHLTPCSPLFHITSKSLTHPALFGGCWSLTQLGFTQLHR